MINFVRVDYRNSIHGTHLIEMLNAYAMDPMGGGQPLTEDVKATLINKLAEQPSAFSVLGYLDSKPEQPVALANCFFGFSTFKAKPLLNIHDCYVASDIRGQGVAQKLLTFIQTEAENKGCCKITLEVLEGNTVAKSAYLKYGFKGYELDPDTGKAMFWEKPL